MGQPSVPTLSSNSPLTRKGWSRLLGQPWSKHRQNLCWIWSWQHASKIRKTWLHPPPQTHSVFPFSLIISKIIPTTLFEIQSCPLHLIAPSFQSLFRPKTLQPSFVFHDLDIFKESLVQFYCRMPFTWVRWCLLICILFLKSLHHSGLESHPHITIFSFVNSLPALWLVSDPGSTHSLGQSWKDNKHSEEVCLNQCPFPEKTVRLGNSF